MQVWFFPVENPYYVIAGKDGTYTIDQVPGGVSRNPRKFRRPSTEPPVVSPATIRLPSGRGRRF